MLVLSLTTAKYGPGCMAKLVNYRAPTNRKYAERKTSRRASGVHVHYKAVIMSVFIATLQLRPVLLMH